MAVEEIMIPAASAAGGGLTTLWVAKIMIQRWLDKNDKAHDKWETKTGDILLAVTRIEEQVKVLRENADRTRENERAIAVLENKLTDMRQHLNGLGQKVRGLESQ